MAPVKRQKRVLGPPRRGMWGARRPLPRPAREPHVPSQGRGRLERRVTGGAGSRSVRGIVGPRGSERPKPRRCWSEPRGRPSQGSLRLRGGRLSVPPWGEAQPLVARVIGPSGEANGLQGPPGSAPLPGHLGGGGGRRLGGTGQDGASCGLVGADAGEVAGGQRGRAARADGGSSGLIHGGNFTPSIIFWGRISFSFFLLEFAWIVLVTTTMNIAQDLEEVNPKAVEADGRVGSQGV